jgi:hypothetical protein
VLFRSAAGVPGRKAALCHKLLQVLRKLEQPYRVDYRCAVFPRALTDLLRSERELGCQGGECDGGIDRVKVLALNILNQTDFEQPVVRNLTNGHWDFVNAGQFGGTPTPFTGNELKAATGWTHYQRLDNAVRANGLCQFRQAIGWEDPARLQRVGVDGGDWDRLHRGLSCWFGRSWDRLRASR